MFLIPHKGATPRPICRECARFHKRVDCPRLEGKILLALAASVGGSFGGYQERIRKIAAALGVPVRRVKQTVGRLMRDRRLTG